MLRFAKLRSSPKPHGPDLDHGSGLSHWPMSVGWVKRRPLSERSLPTNFAVSRSRPKFGPLAMPPNLGRSLSLIFQEKVGDPDLKGCRQYRRPMLNIGRASEFGHAPLILNQRASRTGSDIICGIAKSEGLASRHSKLIVSLGHLPSHQPVKGARGIMAESAF